MGKDQKNGGNKMADKNESQKEFSTCLEGIPCAEMMQKMMGQKGIGSLCGEMMRNASEKQGRDGSVHCAEMMRSMMKGCGGLKKKSKETKKEESHVGDK
jgi:hypothetical protein